MDYHHWLALLSLAVSLLIAAVVIVIWPDLLSQNSLHLKEPAFDQPTRLFAHDFDHNGWSERIYFKYEPLNEKWGIKVASHDDRVIDQWNLSEPWHLPRPIFGDFDNDLWDEMYFFTQSEDSLFLYGLDIRKKDGFFLERVCLDTAPNPLPGRAEKWDVTSIHGLLLDGDGDGYLDLYLVFYTGFALQPRGFLAYSIHRQKVLYRSEPMGVGGMSFLQTFIPDSRSDTLIFPVHNHSTDNYYDSFPYADDRPWLMVLDPKLRFRFPPKPFPPVYSKLKVLPVSLSGMDYLAVLHLQVSVSREPAMLYLYDLSGKEIARRSLGEDNLWRIYTLPTAKPKRLLLASGRGELEELDENLSPIRLYHPGIHLDNLLLEGDFDGDRETEYCFATNRGISIFESDFTAVHSLPYPNFFLFTSAYPFKTGTPGHLVLVSNPERTVILDYRRNRLAGWWRLLFAAGVGLLWLLSYRGFILLYRGLVWRRGMSRFWREGAPGLALLDARGEMLRANPRFRQLAGITETEQTKKPIANALKGNPALQQFANRLLAEKKEQKAEVSFSLNGRLQSFPVAGIPLTSGLGILLGYQIRIFERNENGLMERLKAWGQTVQKMAHDIKTPLSAVQLSLQTIQYKLQDQHPATAAEMREEFELISQELQRVREMSRSFIRFVNLERPESRLVLLPELIMRVQKHFQQFTADGRIQIETDLDDACRYLMADPQQLEMVFQIVLENAVEALEGKGRILITSSLAQYLSENMADFVEIEIADSGPGIDPEIGDKIFDPYFTTKKNGTGMGLAIARKIVEEHGGRISLNSRPGFATIIQIVLPIGNVEGEKNATNSGH
ncbi:MAG: hypothetical protein Kow0037_32430 [Calditrichia bacterium]